MDEMARLLQQCRMDPRWAAEEIAKLRAAIDRAMRLEQQKEGK